MVTIGTHPTRGAGPSASSVWSTTEQDRDGVSLACRCPSTLWNHTDNMGTGIGKRLDSHSKLERALATLQVGDLESAQRQFEELVMDDAHDPLAPYNLGSTTTKPAATRQSARPCSSVLRSIRGKPTPMSLLAWQGRS